MKDDADRINDFLDWRQWAVEALTDPFRDMVVDWQMFRNQRRDPRKKHESWRAFTCSPKPFKAAIVTAGQVWDIINAGDPPIQAVGVGQEDIGPARKVERLQEMTLNMNRWALRSYLIALEMSIQGVAPIKVTWRDKTMRVRDNTAGIEQEFGQAMQTLGDLGESLPQDPDEYERIRKERPGGIVLPPHPRRAFRDIVSFRGPAIERVSIFDLLLDPLEEEWSQQRRVAQRSVKPRGWVLARTGDSPEMPFDPAAVEMALNDMPEEQLNEWQADVAKVLGVERAGTGYPAKHSPDLVELYEYFDPEDEEQPYKIILNRKAIINKERVSPYGYNPIHLVRLHPIPGLALGQSALRAPRELIREYQAMRDLQLDALTLATLPIFQTLNGLGIPDVAKLFRPGMTIPLPSANALSRLELGSVHPDSWRGMDTIASEIDDVTATYSSTRGAPSTVGRVSAAEAHGRASSALLQHKVSAALFESDMRPAVSAIVACWYEHGDDETLIKAGGLGTEAYRNTISRDELLSVMDTDFQFRGPSRAINKEMQVQQLYQYVATFGQVLGPDRLLAIAQECYELLGFKNKEQVVPDEDIAKKQEEVAMQEAAAQQQAAMQAQQAQPQEAQPQAEAPPPEPQPEMMPPQA